MKWLTWTLVGMAVSGVGLVSCSTILGCHNPTGYCGESVPDPNRIGGPSWFLSATADERITYYGDRCLSRDATLTSSETTACARQSIVQNAHQYCVDYYLPPMRPKGAAEAVARERDFSSCKTEILAQHGL